MKNIQNVIDKLVTKVLNEELESKVKNVVKTITEAEGKGCAESEGGSGCIKKRGNEWIILNNKKGGIWRDGFKSEKDAKDALDAFHANESVVEEGEGHVCEQCGMNEEMCECGSGMYEGGEMKEYFYDDMDLGDGMKSRFDRDSYEKEDHELRSKFKKRPSRVVGVYSKNSDEDGLDKDEFRTPAGFEYGEIVSGDMDEQETTESNAFVLAADAARDAGKKEFEFPEGSGKMHKVTIKKDIKTESKKRTLQLTESEMIELIERIVMEQKAEGLTKTEKVLNKSKKENEQAIKDVNKKMKAYVKDGSEEAYTPDAKHFPQGNGELKKTEKMAYTPSDAVEEYIDQIARSGGMENLDYDEIKPNDEWLEMNIEGSSKTGNSQEYANAVPTDANKKVNDRRKKNYLAKLKAQSYNKAPQPVYDIAGKSTHNDAMGAPDNLMAKLESVDDKKKTKINEEIQKMINLSSYNKKTQ